MKKSLLVIAVCILPMCTQAQITLDYSNAPSDAQCQIPDSMDRIKLNTLPDVSPKTNATWDITTATDSNIYANFFNHAASSSAFPTATFVMPGDYVVSSGLTYHFEAMADVSTNGIVRIGEHIDRQAIPLVSLTGNTNDTLVFTTQDITYNVPEHEVKYPCTMGTKWTDNLIYGTDFNLTVTSASLNKTPGQRKTYRTIEHEVTGWGKMRVNDANDNPTGYMDVLIIDMIETTEDSFFLGGMPAPASLLTAFGLTQGQKLVRYDRHYYRAGEYRGLLEIRYDDAAFTKPLRIFKHRHRLKPTAIEDIPSANISIYPNPVSNNSFTVKMDGINSNISYQLYNITGQSLAAGNVPANGTVNLQSNISSGSYFIKLKTDDGMYGVKQINIIN